MIYFLIILLFGLCLFDFIKNKNILSPTFIFNFIWFITLLLYEFKLSYIQQDLSSRTIICFLCCILGFNVFFFFFKLIKVKLLKIKFNPKFSIDRKVKIAKYIAIVIFIIEVIYSKGFPLLWKVIGSNKNYFDFGIPSLNGAFYGLIICLGAYSLFTKSKDKYIYFIMGILIISRQVLLSMILEGIVFAIYHEKIKINPKKIIIIGILTVIGFTMFGNFRSGSNVMNDVFQAKEKYKNLPSSFKWVYSYMTFSVSNFNNLVSITDGGVNHGASMLTDFMPTVFLEAINIKPTFNEFYLISLNYNVSTYLPSIYLDFGIAGIIIFNAFIAFLGYQLYYRMKNDKSIKNILMYSIFIHNIIFLFFINMFLYLPIIVQFIYIPLIFYERKEECSNEK